MGDLLLVGILSQYSRRILGTFDLRHSHIPQITTAKTNIQLTAPGLPSTGPGAFFLSLIKRAVLLPCLLKYPLRFIMRNFEYDKPSHCWDFGDKIASVTICTGVKSHERKNSTKAGVDQKGHLRMPEVPDSVQVRLWRFEVSKMQYDESRGSRAFLHGK